ncbi:hypothetical protein FBZ81_103258 [Azospirillum brasilense]|nr:hypothetical protein OH82_00429 [Azospirillum brasilense]TWB84990.1 hypothetical protein FBZ81_103258 [Azospirillum brasilense]
MDILKEFPAMMKLAIILVLSLSVLAAPCVYDTDPREPSPLAAFFARN